MVMMIMLPPSLLNKKVPTGCFENSLILDVILYRIGRNHGALNRWICCIVPCCGLLFYGAVFSLDVDIWSIGEYGTRVIWQNRPIVERQEDIDR
jgi:hypothetical protein